MSSCWRCCKLLRVDEGSPEAFESKKLNDLVVATVVSSIDRLHCSPAGVTSRYFTPQAIAWQSYPVVLSVF